ncbi:MAG: hypothetical protein AAF968_13710, partial [Pseudomonadota bacterium]
WGVIAPPQITGNYPRQRGGRSRSKRSSGATDLNQIIARYVRCCPHRYAPERLYAAFDTKGSSRGRLLDRQKPPTAGMGRY